MKKYLPDVTLLGIDCAEVKRLQKALDISSQEIEFAKVKLLTSLPTDDPRKVEIPPINSLEAFSEFCLKDLHKYVDTEYVLLVQHDGFILNPKQWTDEFLKYDYIGAPWLVANWSVRDYGFPEELLGKLVVGNGGFSLRSKKIISLCAKLYKENAFQKFHPEDLAIAIYDRKLMEDNGIKFAPADLAKKFSFEYKNDDSDRWDGQFGFHGLKHTDISKWIKENPQWGISCKIRERI